MMLGMPVWFRPSLHHGVDTSERDALNCIP
jgi:hypothetical protein